MNELINKIKANENLLPDEISSIMQEIMSGNASHGDMTEFLLALRAKGPTVDEITAAAKIMRKFVVPIKTKHTHILDTCGTGGDRKNTFNISTMTALVVAAAGVAVAKHGNRSVSSKCGSADILEGLGVKIDLTDDQVSSCLNEVGIAFLFAQQLHPAMKNVSPVRKNLGVETIFNVLGPLTNPACATHQMMGVYNRDLVEPLAHVLMNLGLKKALVVHGADGLDEITTTDKTFICAFNGKSLLAYDIDPQELGIQRCREGELTGGDVVENTSILKDIIEGQQGPKTDIVLVNAAYALYTAEKVSDIGEGISLARELLMNGAVQDKLTELIKFTQNI